MKNFLQDVVAHTYSLGVIPIVRVTATPDKTYADAVSDDKKMLMNCTTHSPITTLDGVFGLHNLNKLDLHLKCPEYQDGAKIEFVKGMRYDGIVPIGLHFENQAGDFQTDYRFMSQKMVDVTMKSGAFKGTTWDIEFQPSLATIQRLKYQSALNTDESEFQLLTKDNNLVVIFGDESTTHAGSFVIEPNVNIKLKNTWSWPKSHVINVLNLNGDKTFKLADGGALEITVDSGVAVYNYTFRPVAK
jgi:hypothetical protein